MDNFELDHEFQMYQLTLFQKRPSGRWLLPLILSIVFGQYPSDHPGQGLNGREQGHP